MTRDPTKDMILAFSTVLGIVSIWQYIELGKAQRKASDEHKTLLARLESIEKRLAAK